MVLKERILLTVAWIGFIAGIVMFFVSIGLLIYHAWLNPVETARDGLTAFTFLAVCYIMINYVFVERVADCIAESLAPVFIGNILAAIPCHHYPVRAYRKHHFGRM